MLSGTYEAALNELGAYDSFEKLESVKQLVNTPPQTKAKQTFGHALTYHLNAL